MKLETSDLVGFIKERHRGQLANLKMVPTLAIVVVGDGAPSASFIRAKQRYGGDIGAKVITAPAGSPSQLAKLLKDWSNDEAINGIVLQLPLPDDFDTPAMVKLVKPAKDIDGLGGGGQFEPATAKGIMWILASLNINLKDAVICVVGQGQLVGRPISQLLESTGAKVVRCDVTTKDLASKTKPADVVISGVGQPGIITRSILKDGAVVIDAGTAEAAGELAGDVDSVLYNDPNVKVTPVPGGVGPMTVAALFDNLVIASTTKLE